MTVNPFGPRTRAERVGPWVLLALLLGLLLSFRLPLTAAGAAYGRRADALALAWSRGEVTTAEFLRGAAP